MIRVGVIILLGYLASGSAWAQCAMCRATLENSINDEGPGIVAGVNLGIMYLFFAPYLLIGVVAFFWYRTSRKNAAKNLGKRSTFG